MYTHTPHHVDAQAQSDCTLYGLDANHSLDFTQRALDYIYQKRLFCARSLLSANSEALRLVYVNVAAQRNMTFVDVEDVLAAYRAKESEYGMRWTELPPQHPSNYTPELVVRAVQAHLATLRTETRDLLLWGYPSADHHEHKHEEELMFPRVSDEIVALEKHLGPIRLAT